MKDFFTCSICDKPDGLRGRDGSWISKCSDCAGEPVPNAKDKITFGEYLNLKEPPVGLRGTARTLDLDKLSHPELCQLVSMLMARKP